MTHEEYAEMLRAALKACAAVCAGETMHKNGLVMALERAQLALATPPPSNKLRDMKDAPRDGKAVLLYTGLAVHPEVGWWDENGSIWEVWGGINDDSDEAFCGWLPLPEVSE